MTAPRGRRRSAWTLGFALLGLCPLAQLGSAAAPPGRYSVSGSTVLDTATGLTWQRAGVFTLNWHDAQTHCNSLSLAGGGWRLPTRAELASLRDVRQSPGPAIDQLAFPDTPSERFWSATAISSDGGMAWQVDFDTGTSYVEFTSRLLRVRCVR